MSLHDKASPEQSSSSLGHRVFRRTLVALLVFALISSPGALATTVTATLGVDNGLAGTDGQGRVLMFAPNPLQTGSSVAHFDRSATPNLLMEPSASTNFTFGSVDLTLPLFQDLGWPNGNSNVVVQVRDVPGVGFNDPQLGAQRMAAINFAANRWGQLLGSSVPIRISVGFEALPCSNGTGVLAQAAPDFLFEIFAGAPVGGTWYPGALAESLSGQNLSLQDIADPNAPDITASFNTAIDNGCLGPGSRYYYGLDGNLPPGTVSFVQVAMHEIAHGLGFFIYTSRSNGTFFLGLPDIFTRFLFDNTLNLTWTQMSAAQRVQSAINTNQLAWNGNRVTTQAPTVLRPGPALTINSPASIAGRYAIGGADFGPPLGSPGITGEVVPAFDGSANPTLACNALVNGPQVQGKIALIDRGQCNFTVKVRNAQQAGARAVIIANNIAGGPNPLGGTDPAINIPAVSVSLGDGQRIRAALDEADPAGNVRFVSDTFQVSEGAGSVNLVVERVGGSTGAIQVSTQTRAGTALAGEDYVASLSFPAFADGEDGIKVFGVPILDDGVSEGVERFTVELSNPTGGAGLATPTTATVTIIDDEPCIASDTVACLLEGRFRLTVRWRDFADETGDGHGVANTDDSTLLWFFEPENWEMLLKVINGCSFNQRYWVFAAATTNVEYTLEVTDLESGITREYTNPLGTAAPALADIEAFATCP